MLNGAQIRTLLLIDYFNQKTDEQHQATVGDLIVHLKQHGIDAVRKTIYSDIESLISFGMDIIVVKSTQNKYFIGNRLFQLPELKMLVDAVESSKVISKKKTAELMDKLCQLTSEAHAEQLRWQTCLQNRIKPLNEKIYYLVDSIQTAILQRKQISFQYFEYTPQKEKILKHNGDRYTLDPYGLEWKNDHYYLIGYSHKHQKIAHFRVDRLHKTSVLEDTFQRPQDFDVASYTNKLVNMYAADSTQQVTLLCKNDLMRVVIDHYGDEVLTEIADAEHFLVTIEVHPSPTFYSWVFTFDGKIRITTPQPCVQAMREIALKFI